MSKIYGVWAVALGAAFSSACTVDNQGNITTPPPPSGFSPASTLPGSKTPDASGGGPSVGGGGPGSASDVSKPWRSSGCGHEPPPEQEQAIPNSRTGYTEYLVTQTGATLVEDVPANAGERQFFVRLPPDYDFNRPYRVLYIGHGCGMFRAGKTATDAFFSEPRGGSEQTVYVGVSVPDNGANGACYDNNNGAKSQEWEAFDRIHTFVEKSFCVDNNRIYVTGYSTGGWLANMWSCYFGGTPSPPLDSYDLDAGLTERKFSPKWAVRGGARMTGSLPDNQPTPCNGPAAGIWIHDSGDKQNQLATNVAALNLSLQTMGCTGNYEEGPKRPWAPAEQIDGLKGGLCQEYTGCSPEVAKNYPLVFCTTNGFGHSDQASTIPAFTAFFDLMDPAP